MTARIIIAAIAALALAGCATTSGPTPASQVRAAAQNRLLMPASRAARTTTNIDGDFRETLAGCQAVLSGFERQALQAKQWSVGLQTAGGLLGAVLLPVAVVRGMAESVTTLLGTLSGFANTEVSVIKNEALDATSILISRASVINSMQTALTDYYAVRGQAPVDLDKLAAASDKLRAACVTYVIQSPTSDTIDAGP